MFFIIEAGARIQTPMDRLFMQRDVNALDKVAPVRRIDEEEPGIGSARQTLERVYRESERESGDRHQIKFAREIMSSPVITGGVDQSLFEIWHIFSERRLHHLPLLNDGGSVQGIVSDRDILRFAANQGRSITDAPISQMMTRRVVTATADTEVRDLAEVMVRHGIGAIPLLDEQSHIEGIVSRSDILRTLVNRAPLDLWS